MDDVLNKLMFLCVSPEGLYGIYNICALLAIAKVPLVENSCLVPLLWPWKSNVNRHKITF